MLGAGLLVELGACCEDPTISVAMTLGRTHELQIAMLVHVVVPTLKTQCPAACFLQTYEHTGVLRSIFAGSEQALRIGIVITDTGTAVGGRNAQLLQLGDEGRALHHATV